MIVLPGCSAERVLAFASAPRDANGDPGDVGGSPLDAGQDRADVGGGGDDAAGGWTPFGTPQLIGGLRGDTDAVEDPSLTFEELELYFTSPSGGQNDIWVSRRTSATDPWGPSTLVAELSSAQNDEDPEVSVDGLVMYFTSDRGGDGRRVYSSQRRTRDIPWETPVRARSRPALSRVLVGAGSGDGPAPLLHGSPARCCLAKSDGDQRAYLRL
jgi:hypothetical protein